MSSQQERGGEKGGGERGRKKEQEKHVLSVTLACIIEIGNRQHFSLKLAQFFKSVQTIQTLDVL